MVYLYFAFGSNLLSQRLMYPHKVNKKLKGAGCLKDFELRFKGFESKTWMGHSATIEPRDGASVWGAVWELEDDTRPLLDKQEWCYNPTTVQVALETGETVDCLTYQIQPERNKDPTGKPSPYYLDVIVRGAKQSGLPLFYQEWLRGLEHNKYSGPVTRHAEVMELLKDDPTYSERTDCLLPS